MRAATQEGPDWICSVAQEEGRRRLIGLGTSRAMGGGPRKPGTDAAMAVMVKFLALNIKNEARSYH